MEKQAAAPWLTAPVSMFPKARSSTGSGKVETLSNFIEGVINGQYAAPIAEIRRMTAAGDEAGRKEGKQGLPGITPGGRVRRASKKASELLEHSGVVVIDLDDLEEDAAAVRDATASTPWTLAAFISPSGIGVKVFAAVTPPPTSLVEHTAAWRTCSAALSEVVDAKVDGSGKDVTRLCFVSHDQAAYTAEMVIPLPWSMSAEPPAPSAASPMAMDTDHQVDNRALYSVEPSINYNEWLAVLIILRSLSFTMQEAEAWSSRGQSTGRMKSRSGGKGWARITSMRRGASCMPRQGLRAGSHRAGRAARLPPLKLTLLQGRRRLT